MSQRHDGIPSEQTAPRVSRRAALTALMAASGAGVGWMLYHTRPRILRPPEAEARRVHPPASQPTMPPVGDPQAVARIYGSSIVPLLGEFDRRNHAAAERAVAALHERVQMHRAGVRPFVKDISSWRTRFGVLRRYSSDAWSKLRHRRQDAVKVSQYVNDKFRSHILSEDALQGDVSAVVAQFDEDLRASRNQLYAQLALPLQQIKLAQPTLAPRLGSFPQQVDRQANELARSLAPNTVVAGLVEITGSLLATEVAQQITTRVVVQILARLGTAMAAEGIEAGGATVAGAAVGGGGGSAAGPVGTLIGLGVGLVIGAIVDWRLSKKFEAKVTEQCERFLITVEQRLRDGSGDAAGLRRVFGQTVTVTSQSQRQAIEQALKENQQ